MNTVLLRAIPCEDDEVGLDLSLEFLPNVKVNVCMKMAIYF